MNITEKDITAHVETLPEATPETPTPQEAPQEAPKEKEKEPRIYEDLHNVTPGRMTDKEKNRYIKQIRMELKSIKEQYKNMSEIAESFQKQKTETEKAFEELRQLINKDMDKIRIFAETIVTTTKGDH